MAKGTSVVVENVFENRFAHAGDLNRMGANVLVNGRTAVVQGVDMLYGTHVTARDLRGGAALVIAGLAARGETLVERAELIDRGYERSNESSSRHMANIPMTTCTRRTARPGTHRPRPNPACRRSGVHRNGAGRTGFLSSWAF